MKDSSKSERQSLQDCCEICSNLCFVDSSTKEAELEESKLKMLIFWGSDQNGQDYKCEYQRDSSG